MKDFLLGKHSSGIYYLQNIKIYEKIKKPVSLFLILAIFVQLIGGVFLFFVVIPPKQAKAAAGFTPTEFVTTVNTDGGGDYLTLSAWESAINADLTASTTKVFSGTRNNTITDGTSVYLYRSGVYQTDVGATTTHLTATQAMFTNASSTFSYTSGDVWCDSTSACNTQYFTISDSGGSVIAVVNASGATEDTTAVTLGGWTKSASNYIDIRGDNTTGKWNTNAYRLHPSNSTCIANTDTGGTTKISNLQLYVDSSTSVARFGFSAGSPTATSKFYISNSIFRLDSTADLSKAHSGIGVGDSDAQIYAKNNVFYDFKVTAGNAVAIWSTSNYNVYAYNNTIFNCDIGLSSGGTNFRAKNNIINNCTADTSGSFNTTSTNNLTDIAPGATNAFGATADSGTTDSATTNKLNDSDQNFLTTVKVGMIIKNTTDTTYTYVTAVDSNGILSINDDIMANAEAYIIYSNFYSTPTFVSETSGSEDLHLSSSDTSAKDLGVDLSADASLAFSDDIDGITRSGTWDIGADEAPSLTQNSYRWYSNKDAIQPDTTAVAENIATTSIGNGEVLRLRMNLTTSVDNLATSSARFRLQYAAATSTCNFYMPWATLASSTDSTSGIWRGYDNTTPADGATTTANLLTASDVFGSYEENNDSSTLNSNLRNLYYAAVGQDTEYDWVVQNNAASGNTTWCFRMVSLDSNNASSTLSSYTNYPQLTTANTIPSVPSSLGSASTTVGNWISSTTPSVSFTLSDTDGVDTTKYEVQIDDTSNFSSPVVDYISGLATQGGRTFQVGQATSTGGYIAGFAGQTLSDASYYWRVLTADNSNASSTWSTANSGNIAFKIDNTAPSSVGAPTFGTVTTSSIVVNMPTTVTESGSGLRTWTARRNSTTDLAETATTTSSITDSTLSVNTQYTYDVKFTDMATNTSSYGTSASKYTLANVPSSPSATANSTSQITFSWNTNSNPGITEYYAENTTKGTNSDWITDTSWASTGLSCGTSYTFRVKARNGNSTDTAWSSDTTVSSSACPVSSGGGNSPSYVPISTPSSSADNPQGGFNVIINPSTSSGQTIGADTTNSNIVSLKLFGGSDAVNMAISNIDNFFNVSMEKYFSSKQWDLCWRAYSSVDPPPCAYGTHYVYVKFFNQYNEVSPVVSDSIVWEKEKPPAVSAVAPVEKPVPVSIIPPVSVISPPPISIPQIEKETEEIKITPKKKPISPQIEYPLIILPAQEIPTIPSQQIPSKITEQKPIIEPPIVKVMEALKNGTYKIFIQIPKQITTIIVEQTIKVTSGIKKITKEVKIPEIKTPINAVFSTIKDGLQLIFVQTPKQLIQKTTDFFAAYFTPLKISAVKAIPISLTSVEITWDTNHPATSKVNYGLSREYNYEYQDAKKVKNHKVILTNLEPDTIYHYEVLSQNSSYAYDADRVFRTPK